MLQMERNIRPPFSAAAARRLVEARYGLRVKSIQPLPSELDRNFRITSDRGAFVFKIAHSSVTRAVLELQNATLRHLGDAGLPFPALMDDRAGNSIIDIASDAGDPYRARLLRYIDGVPLSDYQPHSDALLRDIGRRLGEMSAAMQSLRHTEKRLAYRWNLRNLPAVAGYAHDMPADRRKLVEHFLGVCERDLLPALPDLRQSFIINDANDSNILVRAHGRDEARVAGLIDLGDMVYGATVADLAVALAYIMMGARRPLEKASPVVAAYHRAFPLEEREIGLLWVWRRRVSASAFASPGINSGRKRTIRTSA